MRAPCSTTRYVNSPETSRSLGPEVYLAYLRFAGFSARTAMSTSTDRIKGRDQTAVAMGFVRSRRIEER